MRSAGRVPSRLALLGVVLAVLSTSCHSLTLDAEAPESRTEATAEASTPDLIRSIVAARGRRIPESQHQDLLDALLHAEQHHGLDPVLVLAVIEQESRFDPGARGPRGSLGLMQVRPFVAEDLTRRLGIPWRGDSTLFDPGTNVRLGTAYLAEMIDMYPEVDLALAAYNMGPFRLRRMLARGATPRGTYAGKVGAHRFSFEERYGEVVAAAAH